MKISFPNTRLGHIVTPWRDFRHVFALVVSSRASLGAALRVARPLSRSPVCVAEGRGGSLFVTDDGSNSIWRVSVMGP